MHISYLPDGNVITDSQGWAVCLSDNELDLLARSLTKNANPVDATSGMPAQKREGEMQTAFAVHIVKEQGAAEFAAELRERLVSADHSLRNHIYTGDRPDEDLARVSGKAEGVRLAMSYLDEMLQGLS